MQAWGCKNGANAPTLRLCILGGRGFVLQGRYSDEGYSALDVPTSAAIAYVRDRSNDSVRPASNALPPEAVEAVAKTLLVVDAACDMPTVWLHNHHVAVVPVVVRRGQDSVIDARDDTQSAYFIRHELGVGGIEGEAEPLAPVEIRDHLQSWMTHSIDYVVQITFAANRSKMYVNSLQATQSLVLIHNKVRRSIGNRAPLNARVIDSLTGLTGLAVLLAYAVHLRNRGVAAPHIATSIETFRNIVHTLIVPDDLRYLRQPSQRKDSLSGWKYLIAKMFNIKPVLYAGSGDVHTVARIRNVDNARTHALALAAKHVVLGLATPTVCVSYAGELSELYAMPGFEALSAECRRHRTELITTVMGMTGSLKLGPGALSVSFASERFLP